MPNSPLKILVVEDSENVAEVIARILEPLKKRFPHSTITATSTLRGALEIIEKDPPPDLVTLDLTLDDSDLQNTMAHVERIDDRSPVILVTGGLVNAFLPMLRAREIEVIEKGSSPSWWNDLAYTAAKTLWRRQQKEKKRMEDRLAIMDSLIREYRETANAS